MTTHTLQNETPAIQTNEAGEDVRRVTLPAGSVLTVDFEDGDGWSYVSTARGHYRMHSHFLSSRPTGPCALCQVQA